MASYFDEHPREDDANIHLQIARLIVEGGWTEGMSFDHLFPDKPRPADPEAIKELETVKACDVRNPRDQCLICLDTWDNCEENEKLTKMPCGHLFHSRCILLWLEKMNSCPACRHEIRSNDPMYETWKKQEKRKKEREADIEELHNSMFS